MQAFNEFVDRKVREGKKHLNLMKKLFEKQGMKVTAQLDEEHPFIFLHTPSQGVSFEGVRVYKIGDVMAYRVQKQAKTEPYGKAYNLDLEEMFEDFMEDSDDETDAAKKIVQTVAEEMKKFFSKSSEAEQEIRNAQFDKQDDTNGDMGNGKIILRTTGTDYSNMVSSKM